MKDEPGEARAAGLFLAALAAYFALHTLLRVLLGGTFEPDEAEIVLLAQDWRLAYGSQPPLYNWWSKLVFDLFGTTTPALMAAKNLLLFATYAAMFAALRQVAPVRRAMVGTLALLLLPNLAWWAQRTGSHTVAMVAATAATVAAFLRLARRRGLADYCLFGAVLGLGGLAKLNYWLVPPALCLAAATLPAWRPVVADRRMAAALLVALAIVAGPYAAMLSAPAAMVADAGELYGQTPDPAWPEGLWLAVTDSAAELLLPALALAGIVASKGRGARRLAGPTGAESLMLRAAGIGAGLVAAAVILADIALVRSRWLLPLYMLLVPALFMMAARDAPRRTVRIFLAAAACLAAAILTAIADLRLRGAGSDSLMLDRLAAHIEAHVDPVPPLLGPHYYTGNLKRLRPDWTALPPYPTDRLATPPPRVLVIADGDLAATVKRRLATHGYPIAGDARILASHTAAIPYRFTDGATRRIRYAVVALRP